MKFWLIFYLCFILITGCISSKNELIGKKSVKTEANTKVIVNNKAIEFTYEPTSENVEFTQLPKGDSSDPNLFRDHGTMSKILDSSISKIRVNYYSDEWENFDSVIQFLVTILQDTESRTYDAPVWAQPFFLSILCTVDYKNGSHGKWLVGKDRWTLCIEDQSGKTWFVTHKKVVKAPLSR